MTSPPPGDDEPDSRCVVRVRTSSWLSNRGLHIRKDITFVRRLSSGYQCLAEDAHSIGGPEVIDRITNLDECEDGLYVATITNPSTDWETGYVDDYDYVLTKLEFPGPPLWQFALHNHK